MSPRLPLLLLPLFVCVGAFAAPPVVTFDPYGTYVTISAGHSVAWARVDSAAKLSGVAVDTDNDGRVVLPLARDSTWTVIELETGEWTARGNTQALPPNTIARGTTGTYSKIFSAEKSFALSVALWVRPDVGAWSDSHRPTASVPHAEGRIVDALQLGPLSVSPATPTGFASGDLLFLLNYNNVVGGLVDPQFDDPASPGTLVFDYSHFGSKENDTIRRRIVRLGGTEGTVRVRWSVAGTAEPGIDYRPIAPAEVVFGPGETDQMVTPLETLDDGVYNATDRTLVFTLSDPSGGATVGARPSSTTTLQDDDPAPLLAFGDVPTSVSEGDADWLLDVPFSVIGAFRGTLPVSLGSDSETIATFALTPEQPQQIGKFPISANDGIADLPVTMTIRLRSSAPKVVGISRILTVIDDDPPRISIPDKSVDEDSSFVSVLVATDWKAAAEGTLFWSTADGTAHAGEDYVAKSGSTTISQSGRGDFSVVLIPDDAAEGSETFYVDVTSISGPLLPPLRTRIAITIIDDDLPPPALTIESTTVTEANIDQSFPLRVTLASPATSRLQIHFSATSEGTASPFKDFYPPHFLIFEPGEITKEATILIYGDIIGEPEETAVLSVKDKWSHPIGTGTVTILDDDGDTWPVVTISAPATVEGNSGETLVPVKVQLATALSAKVKMALWSANGTATAEDYVPLATAVTFQAGETEKDFSVAIRGDAIEEGPETITLTTTFSGMDIASTTLTILDDDTTTSFASIADTHVVEGTGSSTIATFGVLVTPAPKTTATVRYTTEEGTADATDFAAKNGTLSFAPGQTQAQIPVEVFGDAVTEKDERFVVRLFDPNGVTIYDDRASATIDDDDAVARPTLTIGDIQVRETNGWTDATFALHLSHESSETIEVSYETADESAKSISDYEHRSGKVTFASGQTMRTLVVPIAGDAIREETETFTVWLSNGDGVIIPDVRAVCTIVDDDPGEEKRTRRRSARH